MKYYHSIEELSDTFQYMYKSAEKEADRQGKMYTPGCILFYELMCHLAFHGFTWEQIETMKITDYKDGQIFGVTLAEKTKELINTTNRMSTSSNYRDLNGIMIIRLPSNDNLRKRLGMVKNRIVLPESDMPMKNDLTYDRCLESGYMKRMYEWCAQNTFVGSLANTEGFKTYIEPYVYSESTRLRKITEYHKYAKEHTAWIEQNKPAPVMVEEISAPDNKAELLKMIDDIQEQLNKLKEKINK